MSERLDKIKFQVEFYFSDANFNVDKFLKEQSLINEGFIPITTIITFNRLRDLNTTVDDVKEALKNSTIVEIKDDFIKKVETKEYLSYVTSDISKRVVHISGFSSNSTLEDIREQLMPHMTPVLIRMRKNKSKEFTGSVLVELKSEEDVERVLKEKICAKRKDNDVDVDVKKQKSEEQYLLIMKKSDYIEGRNDRLAEKKKKNVRKALEKEFVPRLFKYECKEDLDIATIKSIIKDVAFVDVKKKVIRMKYIYEFKTKKFENEGKTLILNKMEEEEAIEYCNGLNIKPMNKLK